MAWDDFLDDLQDAASEQFSNVSKSLVQGGLTKLGFIKVGQPPLSNLTANQVASGMTGQPASNIVAQQGPGSAFGGMMQYLPYIVIALIVGAAFLFRKK